MKKRSHLPLILIPLLIVCILPVIYAAVTKKEAVALLGILPAFLLLTIYLAGRIRYRQFQKIFKRDRHLLSFEYSFDEIEEIIQRETPSLHKTARGLALLFGLCFLIIAAPFAQIALENNDPATVCAAVGIVVLFPVLCALAAPAFMAGNVRKDPCRTCVGPDYILIANRYPGINDYSKLRLEHADLLPSQGRTMQWMRLRYSYIAMRSRVKIQKTVDVPVPVDRTGEAEAFIKSFMKPRQAKKQQPEKANHSAAQGS